MSSIEKYIEISSEIDEINSLILKKTKDLVEKRKLLENQLNELSLKITDQYYEKEYGQQTVKDCGYSITISKTATHSLDKEAWSQVKEFVDPQISPVSYEPKLSVKELNNLKQKDPENYKIMCKAVTLKISEKPKVEIKVINK